MIITDNDLTEPGLSLEERITLVLPGGQRVEFNHYGIFKDEKRYPFEKGSKVEGFFHGIFSEAQDIQNAVDEAISRVN